MTRAAFTVAEVADLYGVSESHIRRLIRNGTLERVPHMGARIVVSPLELERVFGFSPKDDAASERRAS